MGDESRSCSWPTATPPTATATAASEAVTSSVTAPPAATGRAEEGEGEREGCLDSLYHYYDCLAVRNGRPYMWVRQIGRL